MSAEGVPLDKSKFLQKVSAVFFWLVLLIAVAQPLQYLHLTFLEYSSGDEGFLLAGALRILRGQVLYRDFHSILAPGSFYLTAFWFRLFGPTLVAARWLAWLINALLIAGLWLLGRQMRLSRISLGLVFLAQVAVGFYAWPILSFHWMANAAVILSAACLAASENERRGWLLAAGALAGIAGLMLQDEGGYWVLLVFVLLLLSGGDGRWGRIAYFVAGVALAASPLMVCLLVHTPVSQIIDDVLWSPLRYYHQNAGNRVSWGEGGLATFLRLPTVWRSWGAWAAISEMGRDVGMATVLSTFPIAGVLLILQVVRFRKLAKEDRWSWLVLLSLAASLALTVLHRPAMTNLTFAFPAFLLMILWGWERLRRSQPSLKCRFAAVPLALALTFAAIVGSLPYPYLAPRSSFEFPAGRLTTEEGPRKPLWTLLQLFQRRFLRPGQTVLCYGYCSFFSFLLRSIGPMPSDNFDIGRYDSVILRTRISQLAASPPDWILMDEGCLDADPTVVWIKQHYKPLARCNGLVIVGKPPLLSGSK